VLAFLRRRVVSDRARWVALVTQTGLRLSPRVLINGAGRSVGRPAPRFGSAAHGGAQGYRGNVGVSWIGVQILDADPPVRVNCRLNDRLTAVFQKTTEYLRPYACFEAALTIGVHSDSVLVGSSRTKADGVYSGLGLPEAFSTCRPLIYLCCFCR
jgi:hypothetical protein